MMKNYKNEVIDKFTINDKTYYHYTEEESNKLTDILIENKGICGIGFKSLPIIDIGKNSKVPILFFATFNGVKLYEASSERNQLFVCIEEKSGLCFTLPTNYDEKQIDYSSIDKFKKNPLSKNAEKCTHFQADIHDLNNLFKIKWKNSRYFIYALYYDWLSEHTSFEIINSNNTEPATMIPDLPSAGQASAVITRSDKKETDVEEKYAIEISDTIDVESDSLPVKITFSVNLKKEWLTFQWENGKKAMPKAIIPVSVFVTKHNQDQKKPVLWHWTVPVYSSEKVNEGDKAEGFLITDLFHEEHNIRVEREFLAWCVVGTHLFGPEKFVLKK